MLLQIFSRLEIVGQLLPQGLLDHPAPSKTNQRFRFRQDQVAQHGETGGHTPSGGVGEQWHVEQLGFAVAFQRSGDLRHLHQAEHPLLHPGTAGGTNDQQRQLAGGGLLDQTGDFLPDHRAHRSPHEAEVHRCQAHGDAFHPAKPGDDTIP